MRCFAPPVISPATFYSVRSHAQQPSMGLDRKLRFLLLQEQKIKVMFDFRKFGKKNEVKENEEEKWKKRKYEKK